jgi:hypothetical protein
VEAVNAAVLTPDVQAEIMADAEDVFEELAGKNRVRVVVHRDVPAGRTWEWSKSDLVHDSWTDKGEVTLSLLPQVVMLDELRVLAGRKPKYVDAVIRRTGGEFRSVTRNLRVNTGIDYVSSALGDSSGSRAAVAQYIALTSSTGTPAATDITSTTSGTGFYWGTNQTTDVVTAAAGEINFGGLARALAAYAHTAGSASTLYTMSKTFTASAALTSVRGCGLFNSATNQAGTLFVENTFTSTSLATNDQLTIQWTINI